MAKGLLNILSVFAASLLFINTSILAEEIKEKGYPHGKGPYTQIIMSDINTELDSFTSQIRQQLAQNEKKTIAVSEFTDLGGNISDLGKFVTDEIITRLILSGEFKVIDRKYFSKILKNQGLSLSNVLDPNSAQTLQNLLGIDAIITGTIVDLGTIVKIHARLHSSNPSNIFGAACMELKTNDNLRNLMEQQTLEPREINLKNKIEDLAQQITQSMVDHKKKKLVIMEFPDLSGEITRFSKFLYEELISHLMMYRHFDVIEKKLYDNLFSEYEGNVVNITSDLSKEIGKTLGADAIAYGTISDLGYSVNINIRLITPETVIPFSIARAEITSDTVVKMLLETSEKYNIGTQTSVLASTNETLRRENLTKSKTKIQRLKKSRRVFFEENFSKYPVGEVLTNWGKGIVVVESFGKKGITSKISGENTITQQVNFPDDFNFSFDVKGTSWTWGTFSLYNSREDCFKMDLRIKDNHFYVNFPGKGEVKVSCNADQYNKVSLVKNDKEFQVYLNNMFVTNNLFENKTPLTDFSLNCRLDTLSLTNFSGTEL